MSNPRVYLDVSINEGPPERMVIELFADVVPRIAENFRAICVGSVSATGKFLHYKGRVFSKIHEGSYALGGVSENQDDTDDESIYGGSFPEEDCELKDSGPGILMMASCGRNEVGSRFLLTFCRLHWLYGHSVFGKVIKGMDTVLNIEQAGTFGRVRITDCGEISDGKVSNMMESDKPQSSSGEEMSNPRVYLDVSINEGPPERMVIELFANVVPRIAENFRAICVGTVSATGKFLHYKGRVFSIIHEGSYALGGVSENQDDTADESIYGGSFPEEDCELKHSGPGFLMMASCGQNKVGCQFLLTFCRLRSLYGHSVFGKVIKGMDTVLNIEQAGTFGRVRITGCGEISDGKVSNMMESDKPQSSSVRKESEAMLQEDNDSKKYETSHGKLEATLKNNVLLTNDNEGELTSKKRSSNPNQHSYDLRKSSGSSSDDGKANRRRVVRAKCIPPSSSVRKEELEAKLQKVNVSSYEKVETQLWFFKTGNDGEVQLSTNPNKQADDPSKSRKESNSQFIKF